MKTMLAATLLFIFAISSCSKSDTGTDVSVEMNQGAIQQLLDANNLESQKTMYRSLNSVEKNEVWRQRFENYLKTPRLSPSQKLFVQDLLGILEPKLFDQGSSLLATLEKQLRRDAITLFGVGEATTLLTTLGPITITHLDDPAEPGLGNNCKCNRTDDWCATYMYCRERVCDPVSGCGTLWQHTCNGLCDL